MATRPAQVPTIQEGKTLYTVSGYTAFTNWMMKVVHNVFKQTKSGSIHVDMSNPESPKLEARYI